jgi:hypothetical protein
MNAPRLAPLLAALLTAVSVAAVAAEDPVAGGDAVARGALPARGVLPGSGFGIKLYALTAETEGDSPRSGERRERDALHVFGEVDPAATQTADAQARRAGSFGVAWQHRVNAADRLAVSAEHGEGSGFGVLSDSAESRAALSWTRQLGGEFKPSLTGSVFLGDEYGRDEITRQTGRRYVGLSVGGQLNVWRDHAPFVALQMRRSYYETGSVVDPAIGALPRSDERSFLSAGWRWYVQQHMSVEAGANLGLNTTGLDVNNPERNRVYLGTRFDFR